MTQARSPLPFLAVACGIATFSVMDGAMKSASIQIGVYLSLLLRSAAGVCLVLPVWLLLLSRWPAKSALKVHALRSAVVTCMASLFFWGLVRMPMAEGIALSFIAPLIALYLAAVLLGERIQAKAIIAALLGLAGVGIIAVARMRTGSDTGTSVAGLLAVLTAAVFYAWNLILQRQQAQVASPVEVALFQNVFMALFLLLASPVVLLALPEATASPLTAVALRDVVLAAALAAVSLVMLTWGYARAETQALVPLEYTALLWAAVAGWLWFGETVGLVTVAGAILIVVGCWIGTRTPETPLRTARNDPPTP